MRTNGELPASREIEPTCVGFCGLLVQAFDEVVGNFLPVDRVHRRLQEVGVD